MERYTTYTKFPDKYTHAPEPMCRCGFILSSGDSYDTELYCPVCNTFVRFNNSPNRTDNIPSVSAPRKDHGDKKDPGPDLLKKKRKFCTKCNDSGMLPNGRLCYKCGR